MGSKQRKKRQKKTNFKVIKQGKEFGFVSGLIRV
jgi:hypothetical protein